MIHVQFWTQVYSCNKTLQTCALDKYGCKPQLWFEQRYLINVDKKQVHPIVEMRKAANDKSKSKNLVFPKQPNNLIHVFDRDITYLWIFCARRE